MSEEEVRQAYKEALKKIERLKEEVQFMKDKRCHKFYCMKQRT